MITDTGRPAPRHPGAASRRFDPAAPPHPARLLAVQALDVPPDRAANGYSPDRLDGHYVLSPRENPHEIELLFKELLIGVTSFFRDPAAWEQLEGRGHAGNADGPRPQADAARVGDPLLDRRGGLFARDRIRGDASN